MQMEFAILIVLILVIIVVITIHAKIKYIQNLKDKIISAFGRVPDMNEMNLESIRRYAEYVKHHDLRIDSITWNDLDMDRVYKRINACLSSVGEEYLYNCLHEPRFEQAELLEREKLIKFFIENPTERFDTQFALARLGKEEYNGVASLIFDADMKLISRPYIYKILAVVPIVFLVVLIFNLAIGAIGLGLSFVVNLLIRERAMKLVDIEIPAIAYFSFMLKCCKRLYKIEPLGKLPILVEMRKPYSIFKKVASNAPTARQGIQADIAESFWMYLNIMFLFDIRHYNRFIELIIRYNQEFHHIYKTIGEIDAALSVLSFRSSLPVFSTPQFCNENALDFEEIYHPLIEKPVTNTHKFDKDSLITGSNASGKSTFIKTLAINGILAQTIFTCSAKSFKTRQAMIVTSMAVRDDLLGGESYFIVEIKSLKRVLDLVAKYPCICYVDEILRGTNTVERIAASAAILSFLNEQDCLCIVASHDIELTRLLSHDNYHFCEQVTNNEISFDYKLKLGPTTTRNAIKLLEFKGFGDEIVGYAKELVSSKT